MSNLLAIFSTAKSQVQEGIKAAGGTGNEDLQTYIPNIVNTVIFFVGIIAVVVIILGGISYATSQGDPGKVKKGKDTILYGIIGLVVALLAYAIVNFVLSAVFK